MEQSADQSSLELAALGHELRTQRQRQGLSVQALSKRAGVSFGLISQLERGLGNPSFSALRRLSVALGVPLPQLFAGAEQDVMVVRAGERARLPVSEEDPPAQRVVRELLTPRMSGSLQVIRSTLPVGFTNEGAPFRHLGTECVTVESGRLLVVHGEQRAELEPGDSITYGCSVPHWWANTGEVDTVVLGAVTPFEA